MFTGLTALRELYDPRPRWHIPNSASVASVSPSTPPPSFLLFLTALFPLFVRYTPYLYSLDPTLYIPPPLAKYPQPVKYIPPPLQRYHICHPSSHYFTLKPGTAVPPISPLPPSGQVPQDLHFPSSPISHYLPSNPLFLPSPITLHPISSF